MEKESEGGVRLVSTVLVIIILCSLSSSHSPLIKTCLKEIHILLQTLCILYLALPVTPGRWHVIALHLLPVHLFTCMNLTWAVVDDDTWASCGPVVLITCQLTFKG